MWLAVVETLKKTIDRVQRPVGVCVKARLKKNKVGLPFRECVFEIRFGYGIDDISSHLEWLKSIGKLDKLEMSEKQIPAFLRSLEKMDNAEVEEWRTVIDEAVRSAWYEIERSFVPTRRKYG
jgi:hypothetical protein